MDEAGTLDLYFASNPTPMWFYERGTLRFLAVNHAAERQYGYAAEEFGRMTLRDIRPPEEVPALEKSVADAAAGLRVVSRVWRHRRKDGSELLVEIHAHSCRFRGREAMLVMALDVTERVRASEALAASEARFRALIEKSSDLIMVFDAEKRLRFWSPGAEAALGWRADEVLGRRIWDLGLIHPEDEPAVAEATAALAARAAPTARVVARHRHRDGSWRLLDGLGRNLTDDPAVRGVVVNARDVTEQRRAEEQGRQAQRLESLGRLAGGVAHDFNNLLTVILSCAEELKDAAAAGRPASPEDVGELQAAGERARELTLQLLSFARRRPSAPVPVDLGEAVRRAERLLHRVLGEDVALSVALAPGPLVIRCDPGHLDQVLMNLAVNARDAMPGGGTLTISTSLVARGSPAGGGCPPGDGDWARLEVRDTGTGLSPEARAHLFEPFFTTKKDERGTGLGLATAYGIVTRHGGHLHVESEPGRGTSFAICFPRSLEVPADREPPHARASRRGAGTVLLVEDDPAVRSVSARALGEGGYRVLAAADGAAALAVARAEPGPIALLVTDVVMPRLTGPALLVALRAERPGIPALFVSGFTADALASAPAEGVPVLAKPYTGAALLAAVQAALDRPPARSR